ncbi:hypothetical protein J5X84_00750 [Streptosporangiaceae bacterium NEAU-GS5]|nr:hypothetical protein [Streptosporangiaceae bacterium NEAU-GS5]
MRKHLRMALAATTGAAVLATGAAITIATPALAADASFSGDIGISDAFIPPSGNDQIGWTIKVKDLYSSTGAVTQKICARYSKDGGSSWSLANVTQPGSVAASDVGTKNGGIDVKGGVPVSSSDAASDKWRVNLGMVATTASCTTSTSGSPDKTFTVAAATKMTNLTVNPNPVTLKSGSTVDVVVTGRFEQHGGEHLTAVSLVSLDGDDSFSLHTALEADETSYYDYAGFDYSTDTGDWQAQFTVTRGSKTYHFVKTFGVKKGSSTTSRAKSKITLTASPKKVKKGRYIKLYGKAYRGYHSWGAWGKKTLRIYFKKKGTKSWKFVGYVKTTSTGKYSKSIKPKYDGYWRTMGTKTSLTNAALSPYKFVDVR